MTHELTLNGKTMFVDYDESQDTLYVTFQKEVNPSYYEELDEDGLMVRKAMNTKEVIGFTVRNVSIKVCNEYLEKLHLLQD
jgi:uncharacterized protein YuzE